MRAFPDLPGRMKSLPLSDKGFPIPFFAATVDDAGTRDFRAIEAGKLRQAVRRKLCWVCGQPLGRNMAFVIGPMCGINRTISDPPSHRECATFSARNCPFLSSPMAKRNLRDMPAHRDAPGIGLKRNPGAVAVWVTRSYRTFTPPGGGILFEIGDPLEVRWFASGRDATRAEVMQSIETGLPHLRELCDLEGPAAHAELDRRTDALRPLLPYA